MNKKIYRILFCVVFVVSIINAQDRVPPEPRMDTHGGGTTVPPVGNPIDGGVLWLLAAGVFYAVGKTRNK